MRISSRTQHKFSANNFSQMIDSQPAWDNELLALAHERKAGMLFVTDDLMPNPYDQLPSY